MMKDCFKDLFMNLKGLRYRLVKGQKHFLRDFPEGVFPLREPLTP
jgi:hypothetical protein